ncbi:MAG TPA: PIG-L deacetylase family protein [Anaerolineales bacterium]|nr:PIG-L deacetylase family protein [Anaerolineales bacterium]
MQRTLLALFAHPDDESFGPGATLAKYALAGVDVHYLCGTRGEVGSSDPEHLHGFASTGDMRWAELACAAQELGLAGIHHLGYRDSGMSGAQDNRHPQALSAQSVENVAAGIAYFIRKLKPQVVMTHDTIGGYRHPDHIMLNRATLMFFERMHDPAAWPDPDGLPDYYPRKLYYPVFSRGFLKFAARFLPLFGRNPRKFGRNQDIDILSLIDVEFPTHAVIDVKGAPTEARARAAACHKSQLAGGPPRSGVMGLMTRLMGQRDPFMRAYPKVAEGVKLKETDLFDGVE